EFTAKEVSEFLQSETKEIQEKISDRMNRAAQAMYSQIHEIMTAKTLIDGRRSGKLDA
ncbi:unnamed protein product, partial [Candidula unifasciata]